MLEHLDQAELAFQRPAMLWFGMLLLIPAAYFIYRRQQDLDVPRRLRIALNVGRVLVLLIIILILSGPYLRLDLTVAKKPILAVLMDRSESMHLPAENPAEIQNVSEDSATTSRIEIAQQALRDGEFPLDDLSDDYEVRFYNFARDVSLTTPDDDEADSKTAAQGSGSFIGEAVKQVVDESAGNKIAGLLVLTDGQNTGGSSVAEAARSAGESGAAVFAVPVGSSQPLGDVAILDVETSALVTVEDTVRVNVTVESTDFDGEPVHVELKDGEKLLDRQELFLNSSEPQQVELTFKAEHEGTHYLEVNIPPREGEPEVLHTNNTDTAFVRISDEKLRVLLIDGHPRWDFRFLKNAIGRDEGLAGRDDESPDVIVETEWTRWSSARQSEALPQTLEEISEYHAIVLGDVSLELLDAEFRALLTEAVRDEGVGLIIQAGTQWMPHRFDAEFQSLLPVRMRRGRAGLDAPAYDPFQIELAREGELHDGMRLDQDTGRNREIWETMPELFWCAAAEQPAAGASVLAWNPAVQGRFGKLPLIAWHHAGDGKVMFVGTDATWRWRLNVGDQYFYKFWGQSLRFVARENDLGKKSWLVVQPTRLERGEKTKIALHAFDEDGEPIAKASQRITLVGPETTESLELTGDRETPGIFVGTFTPGQAGTYRLLYEPRGEAEPARATVQSRVAPDEYRRPYVDRATLELLATTSGGEMLELDALGSLSDKLHVEKELEQVHRETTVWDNWLMLMMLLSIYGTDIGVRRMMGLS